MLTLLVAAFWAVVLGVWTAGPASAAVTAASATVLLGWLLTALALVVIRPVPARHGALSGRPGGDVWNRPGPPT